MTARKVKVYGGNFHLSGHGQVRGIIAGTQEQAAKAINSNAYYVRGYWCETANAIELEIALSKPGILFWSKDIGRISPNSYHEVTK